MVGGVLRNARHEVGWLLLRALLAAARALPLSVLRKLGVVLAVPTAWLVPREVARVRSHIEGAFPDRDQAWRDRVAGAAVRHFGCLLGEVAWLWSVSPRRLLARTCWQGREHLDAGRANGHGFVIVTGHCGNWEWLNLALGAAGFPLTVAAREVYDPRINETIIRLRARFGGGTALRGREAAQRLVRALRNGGGIGLLIDQDIDAPGVFTEFFGRPAWTPIGAAALAAKTGAWLIPAFAARQSDGTMTIRIEPAIAAPARDAGSAAEARVTARLTNAIEGQIRREPSQWVWMHRRWRRQPGSGEVVWRWPVSSPDETIAVAGALECPGNLSAGSR